MPKMSRIDRGGDRLGISGYTIVEVLMFLAISGGLVASIMATVNGEQNKTQFNTSVRNFESELQDIMNDVAIGYYPSNNSFTCTVNVAGVPSIGAGVNTSGTNQECIFSGKALHFAPNGTPGRVDIYTVIGRRQVTSGSTRLEVKSIEESNPRVINGAAGLTDSKTLSAGLEISQVLVGALPRGGLAVISSFGQTNTAGGGTVAGYGGASLMRLDVDINQGFSNIDAAVRSLNGANAITEPVIICIREPGGGGERAAVRITGQGTDTLFDADVPVGCPA